MKNNTLLMPLFRTIDKLLFGIEEINEIDKNDLIDSENEEEFDIEVEGSGN